jgi:hypothetical protein
MQLLQCVRAWSCAPLSTTAVALLLELAQLSPAREYYPSELKVQERVTWHAALPSYAAHEGLALAAQKLLRDSERLRAFFPRSAQLDSSTVQCVLAARTGELSAKAYRLQRESRGEQCRLSAAAEAAVMPYGAAAAAVCVYGPVFDSAASETAALVRAVAQSGHSWHACAAVGAARHTGSVKAQLLALCAQTGALQGVVMAFPRSSSISAWRQLDHNSWLQLYSFAVCAESEQRCAEFTLLATALLYTGSLGSSPLVLALMEVARNASSFADLLPPAHSAYTDVHQCTPLQPALRTALCSTAADCTSYINEKHGYALPWQRGQRYNNYERQPWYEQQESEYTDQLHAELDAAVAAVEQQWPAACTVDMPAVVAAVQQTSSRPVLRAESAETELNSLFAKWHRNRELHAFLDEVTRRLTTLPIAASTTAAAKAAQQQLPSLRVDATETVPNSPKTILRLRCPPPVCSAAAAAEYAAVYASGTTAVAEVTWPLSDAANTAASDQQPVIAVVPQLPAALLAAPDDSTAAQELKTELLTSWLIHHSSSATAASTAAVLTETQAQRCTAAAAARCA